MPQADVVIVGAGVIGLSLAWELAGEGQRVVLLDKSRPGTEASWAGAGMLPPGNLTHAQPGLDQLRAFSHRLWPEWTEKLREETGIDNGFRNCGGLTVSLDGELSEPYRKSWSAEQVALTDLDGTGLREKEPALSPEIQSGFHLPELSQVRNPRHLRALEAACVQRGVTIKSGTPVTRIERSDARIEAVHSCSERITAETFCFCAGAWTDWLTSQLNCPLQVEPVRGQIVLLNTGSPVLKHVIEVGDRYLVPRPDGRLLIGSTMERAGFQKENTVQGVGELLAFSRRLVPQLAEATIEKTWAGLRPKTPRGVPVLGPIPDCENGFVATGHFRSGLQTSPGTAVLMRQILLGEGTAINPEPFSVEANCKRPMS